MIRTTVFVVALMLAGCVVASEHLGNNRRDGFIDAAVPAKPALLWTYQERHAPESAWAEPFGELQFIDFDYSDQVTIAGGLVAFGSSADHAVRAIDAGTAEGRWVFSTEGPVRFAPVLYRERLYVVSDDGFLYCLQASDGSLTWKLRLAPGSERCIGNGQMVSKWPCRSGLLIDDGKLYATACMLYNAAGRSAPAILDAETGELLFHESGLGYKAHYPGGS